MPSLKSVAIYAWNGFVLAALAGLGILGHETDWTFTQWAHHAAKTAHAPDDHSSDAEHPEEQGVEFESAADVAEAGIRFAKVSRRDMAEFLTAPAIVGYVPSGVAHLSARVPGTVWRVERRQGDQIHQGEVLAILDAHAVGDAKSKFLQAMVQAELKELNVERLHSAIDVIPERHLREAEAALREALLDRANAQQSLINLGFQVNYQDLEELDDVERSQFLQFLGLPSSLVAKLDPSTTSANLIPVIAPFDGVLVQCDIVKGEVISPDRSALMLANVDHMLVKLNINKEDALRIAPGQKVTFEPDGIPGQMTTVVRWIGTEVDGKTRSVIAIAELDNPRVAINGTRGDARLLKANTFGIGRIRVRETPSTLVVPQTAIQWDGNQHIVFLANMGAGSTDSPEDYLLEAQPVVIGTMLDDYTEILSGLAEGDQVVADGSHMLKSELTRRLTQKVD